jgi:hypothetical protein
MKCVICEENVINGVGHNPAPVKGEGRCCGVCNDLVVIPARLAMIFK